MSDQDGQENPPDEPAWVASPELQAAAEAIGAEMQAKFELALDAIDCKFYGMG